MQEAEILKEAKSIVFGRRGLLDLLLPSKYKTINRLLDDIQKYDWLIMQTYELIETLNVEEWQSGDILDLKIFKKRMLRLAKRLEQFKKQKISLLEIIAKSE
ncbi:MAG: hypothetical protein PHD95_01375 [Candidatus ainarchaeum sp.]|nr:hypothetical protein [Candidatus ainarchaeum sp.]